MKRNIIRQIYFYAASLITLVIMVVAGAQLVNLGLKSTVFPKADDIYNVRCDQEGNRVYGYDRPLSVEETVAVEGQPKQRELTAEERAALEEECEAYVEEERSAQRQRDFVQNFSMIFVAAPVFWFHFRIAQREREEEKKQVEKA
ncbi:MAG: hypothetical protein ABIJ46_01380 [bacterium]